MRVLGSLGRLTELRLRPGIGSVADAGSVSFYLVLSGSLWFSGWILTGFGSLSDLLDLHIWRNAFRME